MDLAGIRIENFHLAKEVLDKLGIFFIAVEAGSVQLLEVTFPTWRASFLLKLRGVRIAVKQRNLPLVSQTACCRICKCS